MLCWHAVEPPRWLPGSVCLLLPAACDCGDWVAGLGPYPTTHTHTCHVKVLRSKQVELHGTRLASDLLASAAIAAARTSATPAPPPTPPASSSGHLAAAGQHQRQDRGSSAWPPGVARQAGAQAHAAESTNWWVGLAPIATEIGRHALLRPWRASGDVHEE